MSDHPTQSLIQEYYTAEVRAEWRRLVKDAYHRLELDTTLHFLEQHLPRHGLVLDAGGGPGRYTVELARRGFDMVLLDFTPANLEYARRRIARLGLKRRVRELVQGSIVDLSRFADATFDAVICTGGPLSHVLDPADRERAIGELARVAKPGAPVFVSAMSRLSILVEVLQVSQMELELPHFRQLRRAIISAAMASPPVISSCPRSCAPPLPAPSWQSWRWWGWRGSAHTRRKRSSRSPGTRSAGKAGWRLTTPPAPTRSWWASASTC